MQDLGRSTTVQRAVLPPAIVHHLDQDIFWANLRSSRRGAAGAPSGMTAEHVKVVLAGVNFLAADVPRIREGHMPVEILQAVRIDGVAEALRATGATLWSAIATVAHPCTAVGAGCGALSVRVCTVNQIPMRVRGPHRSSDDRPEPDHHVAVSGRNRCVRLHLQSCRA